MTINKNEVSKEEIVVMESTNSEMIETGFAIEKAKESETKQDSSSKASKKKKQTKKSSLDPLLAQVILALIICATMLFMGYNEFESIDNIQQANQQQEVAKKAKNISLLIEKKIDLIRNKFNELEYKVTTTSASDNISRDNVTDNATSEKIIRDDLYPGSQLQYFGLPLNHFSIVDNPAQGHIFLDLLNQLKNSKSNQVSQLVIIKPNTEYASILMAKTQFNENQQLTGILVALLPQQFAQQLLQNIDLSNSSITLNQGTTSSIKLASAGDNLTNAISIKLAIKNTYWNIIYYSIAKNSQFNLTDYLLLAIYFVLSLFAFIYSLYASFKFVKKIKIEKQKNYSDNEGKSLLANKQSIAQLGMNHMEVLTDRTIIENKKKQKNQLVEEGVAEIDAIIFTAYGVRGVYGKQINSAVITHLGHAIAQEMENNEWTKVTIGYDARTSSEELYNALIEGLKPYDLEIIGLGLVPLPVVYYSALTQTNGCCVMVTAGSSTAEINGLKILLNYNIYTRDKLLSFMDAKTKQGSQQCQLVNQDLNHLYINSITEQFNYKKTLKIIVDCANSVASLIIIDLLKMLGCNIISIFDKIDGTFPNHAPHPGKPENLHQLSEKVKSESADLGLSFNADGSSLGVVSSAGDIIWADRILMLLARDLLQNNPGAKILYDVKSSSGLHDWIIKFQGEPELSPTGYSNIKQRMDFNKALLAGEFSGHFFLATHLNGLDDSFYIAATICQIVSDYASSSENLFKEIPDKISTPEVLIAVQPGEKKQIMEKIISQKNEFIPAGIITLDGLRVEYEDGWGLVRQSETTSALSLRFEADTPQVLQRIAEKFKEVILSVVFVKFPY